MGAGDGLFPSVPMLVPFLCLNRLEVGTVLCENTGSVLEDHPDIIYPGMVIYLDCLTGFVCQNSPQLLTSDVIVRWMQNDWRNMDVFQGRT